MTKIRKFRPNLALPILLIGILIGCKESASDDEGTPGTTTAVTVDWSSALTALGVNNSYIASITVTATASGMTTVTQSPAATTTTASLTVPAGSSRTFTVKLTMKSTHAAKTFSAAATADLAAGVAKTVVPASFAIGETRILVPDAQNQRLVMMDDMAGANRQVLDATTLKALLGNTWSFTGAYAVWDAEIDSKGRVYAAMTTTDGSNYYGLARLYAFDDASPEMVVDDYSIRALALDETNGYVYYTHCAEGTMLYRLPLSAANLGAETRELVSYPAGCASYDGYGLAVDADGFIYMTSTIYPTTGEYEGVVKFKPGDATYTSLYDMSAMYGHMGAGNESCLFPWDVTVKGDYVYVSVVEWDSAECAVGKIVQLNKSGLTKTAEFGWAADPLHSSTTAKEFFGPRRFLAEKNSGFYLIDEASLPLLMPTAAEYDRIVYFEDMSGTGWKTYGSTGTGDGQFAFWE